MNMRTKKKKIQLNIPKDLDQIKIVKNKVPKKTKNRVKKINGILSSSKVSPTMTNCESIMELHNDIIIKKHENENNKSEPSKTQPMNPRDMIENTDINLSKKKTRIMGIKERITSRKRKYIPVDPTTRGKSARLPKRRKLNVKTSLVPLNVLYNKMITVQSKTKKKPKRSKNTVKDLIDGNVKSHTTKLTFNHLITNKDNNIQSLTDNGAHDNWFDNINEKEIIKNCAAQWIPETTDNNNNTDQRNPDKIPAWDAELNEKKHLENINKKMYEVHGVTPEYIKVFLCETPSFPKMKNLSVFSTLRPCINSISGNCEARRELEHVKLSPNNNKNTTANIGSLEPSEDGPSLMEYLSPTQLDLYFKTGELPATHQCCEICYRTYFAEIINSFRTEPYHKGPNNGNKGISEETIQGEFINKNVTCSFKHHYVGAPGLYSQNACHQPIKEDPIPYIRHVRTMNSREYIPVYAVISVETNGNDGSMKFQIKYLEESDISSLTPNDIVKIKTNLADNQCLVRGYRETQEVFFIQASASSQVSTN